MDVERPRRSTTSFESRKELNPMSRIIALTIFILFISTVSFAQSGPQLNRDPATVKFVTSDIDNFWRAYDLAAKETDKVKRVAIFQTEYLDKGSPGLKDFLRLRINSAENLVGTMDRMPKYETVTTLVKRLLSQFSCCG